MDTKIYHYDRENFEFLAEGDAVVCPITKKDLIIPAYATQVKPPNKQSGKTVCFINGIWEQVTDKRGVVFYNQQGCTFVQNCLGELPEWALLQKPQPEEPEEPVDNRTVKEKQTAKIQLDYANTVNQGINYNNNVFNCDDSTLSIIGARLAFVNSSSSIVDEDERKFFDKNKNCVIFAKNNDFVDFCKHLIMERNNLDQKRITLKKQIIDATTDAEVLAIVW